MEGVVNTKGIRLKSSPKEIEAAISDRWGVSYCGL